MIDPGAVLRDVEAFCRHLADRSLPDAGGTLFTYCLSRLKRLLLGVFLSRCDLRHDGVEVAHEFRALRLAPHQDPVAVRGVTIASHYTKFRDF